MSSIAESVFITLALWEVLKVLNCKNAYQVYFKMLDALLAEEKIPDEFSGQSQVCDVLAFILPVQCSQIHILMNCKRNLQVILCNDCEKKGPAPFHWLYHKCSSCGSYNTRLL